MFFLKRIVIAKKINRRKILLNILLLFLSPNNKLMIKLSQNLDTYISLYQSYLSKNYFGKKKNVKHSTKKQRIA